MKIFIYCQILVRILKLIKNVKKHKYLLSIDNSSYSLTVCINDMESLIFTINENQTGNFNRVKLLIDSDFLNTLSKLAIRDTCTDIVFTFGDDVTISYGDLQSIGTYVTEEQPELENSKAIVESFNFSSFRTVLVEYIETVPLNQLGTLVVDKDYLVGWNSETSIATIKKTSVPLSFISITPTVLIGVITTVKLSTEEVSVVTNSNIKIFTFMLHMKIDKSSIPYQLKYVTKLETHGSYRQDADSLIRLESIGRLGKYTSTNSDIISQKVSKAGTLADTDKMQVTASTQLSVPDFKRVFGTKATIKGLIVYNNLLILDCDSASILCTLYTTIEVVHV